MAVESAPKRRKTNCCEGDASAKAQAELDKATDDVSRAALGGEFDVEGGREGGRKGRREEGTADGRNPVSTTRVAASKNV